MKESFNPPKGYIFPATGEKQHYFFKIQCNRWFEYHCWESEKSSDADLWHRTHQKVTVLRRLMPNESDYEMYEVKFNDGFVASVFWDELLRSRNQFERPDYK